MKIKVSNHLKNAICTDFIRQWCEALLSLPEVIQITEESGEFADVGIDVLENVGISVFIELSDPHSLVNLIDVDTIQKKWFHLLPDNFVKPSIAFKDMAGNTRTIPFYEPYDVCTFVAMQPYIPLDIKPKIYHLPNSIPNELFYSTSELKTIDVILCGNKDPRWYPIRNKVWEELKKQATINTYFSEDSGVSAKQKVLQGITENAAQLQAYMEQLKRYSALLRQSKIMIFDGGFFDYPVKKYFECMASGCLVLAPMPMDSELLGFVDGVNMVVVDESNFMEKCRYYLEHEDERKEITDAAYKLYQERHTCIKSAERFLAYLKTI